MEERKSKIMVKSSQKFKNRLRPKFENAKSPPKQNLPPIREENRELSPEVRDKLNTT